MLGLGWLAARTGPIPGSAAGNFASLVVNFALPLSLFLAAAGAKPSDLSNPAYIASLFVGLVGTYAAGVALGLLVFKHDRRSAAVQGLTCSFPNMAYCGPPVLAAVVGSAGITAVLLGNLVATLVMVPLTPVLLHGKGNWEGGARLGRLDQCSCFCSRSWTSALMSRPGCCSSTRYWRTGCRTSSLKACARLGRERTAQGLARGGTDPVRAVRRTARQANAAPPGYGIRNLTGQGAQDAGTGGLVARGVMSTAAWPAEELQQPAWRRVLHLVLTPSPGRLRNTLLQVGLVLVVAVIWETFRIPETAVACYFVLFLNKNDRTSTGSGALGVAVLGSVAMLLVSGILMVSLSQPAVRIGTMALLTFGSMYMSRASTAGTAFFASGYLAVYALTSVDPVTGLALQPATVSNNASLDVPSILFMPPEEAGLHFILWFVVILVLPGVLVALGNKAFGLDPAVILKCEVDSRLDACAAVLDGRPGAATRLMSIARGTSPPVLQFPTLAQKDHGPKAEPLEHNQAAIRAVTRLMLSCIALDWARKDEPLPGWMTEAARRCRALRFGRATDVAGTGPPCDDSLGREVGASLDRFAAAETAKADPARRTGDKPQKEFWTKNANKEANAQFALKVTLSVMICYILNNALDWTAIGTSVSTCFFVALGSLGESAHKITLRITGALLGAGVAIAAIILLMPLMTELSGLLLLLAAATFVGAWVGSGSPRISYAGLQISFAFFLITLQGYGRVTDMETAKNRIIGIFLGLTVSYVVLAYVWPVRVDQLVASSVGDAAKALGQLLRRPDSSDKMREGFAVAIAKARVQLEDGLFEGTPPGRVRIDEHLVNRVEALVIPVSMLAATDERSCAETLASWFDDVAGRFKAGACRLGAFSPPPVPDPASDHPLTYGMLRHELAALPFGDGPPRQSTRPHEPQPT